MFWDNVLICKKLCVCVCVRERERERQECKNGIKIILSISVLYFCTLRKPRSLNLEVVNRVIDMFGGGSEHLTKLLHSVYSIRPVVHGYHLQTFEVVLTMELITT